jgi:hypothetical protein
MAFQFSHIKYNKFFQLFDQQYPPGTQNNYVVFMNLFVVTETGKELLYPKGGKGF